MLICFHLDGLSEILGVFWEIPDGVQYDYKDELSVAALLGREEMEMKPDALSWPAYWTRLADRLSPLSSYVMVEVDDESHPSSFLYELARCHPSDPTKSVATLVDDLDDPDCEALDRWLEDLEAESIRTPGDACR
jgi:hypothetical protein